MSPETNKITPADQKSAQTKQPSAKPDWAKSDSQLGREARMAAGQPSRRRRWPWVAGLVVLAAVAGGYYYYDAQFAPQATAVAPVDVAEPVQAAMQINPDEMGVLQPQRLERRVRVSGTLAPWRSTQLSSQTGGEIEDVTVRPGDTVEAGDLLVQIDTENLLLELDQARSNVAATRAQLALAEVQLDRIRALVDRGVTTSSSLDEAQSSVTQLNASLDALDDQVAGAELRLRNATVRAPFSGIVSSRAIEPGQYVGVGTPLISIVDLSTVEMRANAAVADGALLQRDQSVIISVDGVEGRSFEGRVARINPVAEEGTRTIPVYVMIENPDGILLGGMFASAQVVVDAVEDAIAMPTRALREDVEGAYVLRIEGDALVRQAIETGGTWGGRLTQITSGLETGQRVVTAPLPALQPGDTVALVEN
ncbi:efflux RND transporter periplasmic adaptor subunit [Yoonia algicola]|uniref:Efflux RND transporter periplasmic adaptor subunit n=1 Tax=Yoonia algicola TaxID=3137368 RepID=A0AAN0NI37_9RHOB